MNNIRIARIKAGMKQKELALFLGVTQVTVSHIENRQRIPTKKMLDKLRTKLTFSEKDNFDYELSLLHKNLTGLSCDAIQKINSVVELIKKGKK